MIRLEMIKLTNTEVQALSIVKILKLLLNTQKIWRIFMKD